MRRHRPKMFSGLTPDHMHVIEVVQRRNGDTSASAAVRHIITEFGHDQGILGYSTPLTDDSEGGTEPERPE